MEITGLDPNINYSKVEGIKRGITKYFPEISPEQLEDLDVWFGFRPCSPDGLPYIGRTNSLKNLSIASGHAMMGLSLGPITGMLVAKGISNNSNADALIDPDRFSK